MSVIDVIKKLLGLAGVDEATTTAIGGAAQMAAGMAQSSANGDAMDTMFAQGYVYGIARQVSDLNTEDFTDALKRRSFDEAKMRLEGLEEDVRDFVAEMREEEPLN